MLNIYNFKKFLTNKNNEPWILLTPSLIVLVPLPIFLFEYIIRNSLYEWSLSMPWLGKNFVGIDNFITLLADDVALSSINTALIFTFSSLIIELFLGLSVGHLLIDENRLMNTLRSFILLPMVITPVVVGLLWRMMYQGNLGIISYTLGEMGLPKTTILGDIKYALIAVIITSVWQNAPFLILVVTAGLKSLPLEPYEAALIDGASKWEMFIHITLPLLRPLLIIALLIRFIDAFRTFDIIYIMTAGGPGITTETISMHIFRKGFIVFDMGYAAALTLILFIVVNIFVIIFLKITNKQKNK